MAICSIGRDREATRFGVTCELAGKSRYRATLETWQRAPSVRFFVRLASTFAISWPPNSSLLELEPSRPVRTYAVERHKDFPPDVSRRLRKYVYRLIDPRNGETFYVGKGEGNRVFAHIRVR